MDYLNTFPFNDNKQEQILDIPYLPNEPNPKTTLADVIENAPDWAAQLKFANKKNLPKNLNREIRTNSKGPYVKLGIFKEQLLERERRLAEQYKEDCKNIKPNIRITQSDDIENLLPILPKYNYRKLTTASEEKLQSLWFAKTGRIPRCTRFPTKSASIRKTEHKNDEDQSQDADDKDIEHLLPAGTWSRPQNKIQVKTISYPDGKLKETDATILVDTGADGCLISSTDVKRLYPNCELTDWQGPGFISGHDSYQIEGQLAGKIKVDNQILYVRWCVVNENTIPILGMDFISHYKVRHCWEHETFRFSIPKSNVEVETSIYLAPKMVRLSEACEISKKTCNYFDADIINRDDSTQYIIEPAFTTRGTIRLFRGLNEINPDSGKISVAIGNWDVQKVFIHKNALVGYAYPVEEVQPAAEDADEGENNRSLFGQQLQMFKEIYYTPQQEYVPHQAAQELYESAQKYFSKKFHINSVKSYEEYKISKDKENVANAKVGAHLTKAQQHKAREWLCKFKHVFSLTPAAPKKYNGPEFEIDTQGGIPVKQNPRRYSPAQHQEIERQVKVMCDGGIISPSNGPWGANVVLAKKKTGEWRFAVDFRYLNSVTRKDSYPIPRVDDCLDALGTDDAKLFSVIDCASGFHEIPVKAEDREKLAFVTRSGQYHFNVMPFGVTNAPSFWQRGIDNCLRDEYFKTCMCLIDDIIVWSKDFESHLTNLENIFNKLHDFGFTLKLSKCAFFQESVEFLGFIISAGHVAPNPSKVSAISDFEIPKSKKGLQRFLGMCGWYRRFVPNFANIAAPLYALTSDTYVTTNDNGIFDKDSPAGISFSKLKLALTLGPLLRLPNFTKTFYIKCDASLYGTGAVLVQDYDGYEHPIHYYSKSLSKDERGWHSYELEMLSLVRALKAFKHYFYGQTVVVITDCRALAHWNTVSEVNPKVDRWLCSLQGYDIVFQHRPGKLLLGPDALSRDERFLQLKELDDKYRSKMNLTFDPHLHPEQVVEGRYNFKYNGPNLKEVEPMHIRVTQVLGLSLDNILLSQNNNRSCHYARKNDSIRTDDINSSHLVKQNKIFAPTNQEMKSLLHQKEGRRQRSLKWTIENTEVIETPRGKLLIKKRFPGNSAIRPFIPPGPFRKRVIAALHKDIVAGHLSYDRTLQRVASRFWWDDEQMEEDIRQYCNKCTACSRCKPRKKNKVPFAPLAVHGPWTDVHLDYCVLPESKGTKLKYLLCMIDRFTKWCELAICTKQDADHSAAKFEKRILKRHGVPRYANTDGGSPFKDKFDQLCDEYFIIHVVGLPYRHQTNGIAERLIRSVEQYFSFYCNSDLSNWPDLVVDCQHALNTGFSYATEFSPYRLNYGYEAATAIQNEVALSDMDTSVSREGRDADADADVKSEDSNTKEDADESESTKAPILNATPEELMKFWKRTMEDEEDYKENVTILQREKETRLKEERGIAKEKIKKDQDERVKRSTPKNRWIPKIEELVDIRIAPEKRTNDASCRWYGPYCVWGREVTKPNVKLYNPFVGKDAELDVHEEDIRPYKGERKREIIPQDEFHKGKEKWTVKQNQAIQRIAKKLKKNVENVSVTDLIGKRIQVTWTQAGAKGNWPGTVVDYEPRINSHWVKYDKPTIEDGEQIFHYSENLMGKAPPIWKFI